MLSFVGWRLAIRLKFLQFAKKFSIRDRAVCRFPHRWREVLHTVEMTIWPACVEVGDDGVAVERLVCDRRAFEIQSFDERRDADRVESAVRAAARNAPSPARRSVPRIFGGHSAFRAAADGLVFVPPFAPCPWRWTLTMVNWFGVFRSGSSETAYKHALPDARLRPVAKSHVHGYPVAEGARQISPRTARGQSTARLRQTVGCSARSGRDHRPACQTKSGSIFTHRASVKTNRYHPQSLITTKQG